MLEFFGCDVRLSLSTVEFTNCTSSFGVAPPFATVHHASCTTHFLGTTRQALCASALSAPFSSPTQPARLSQLRSLFGDPSRRPLGRRSVKRGVREAGEETIGQEDREDQPQREAPRLGGPHTAPSCARRIVNEMLGQKSSEVKND